MTEKRVSVRYARAVFQTALQANLIDVVYNDFLIINKLFKESRQFRTMSISPVFQNWKKKKIYDEVFGDGKVSKLALDFLLLLIDKRRAELIPSIVFQFIILYNLEHNRLPLEITSAHELTDNIKAKLEQKITSIFNKTIFPEYKINPAIKGGILVKIDDWVYDASIQHQLSILYKELSAVGIKNLKVID